MNSTDFANLEFDTIGLEGKWLDLIRDPSSNFTAMVFGKPKMGKSYLCVDFAGYLARNHGKVLYVAKEEGLDMVLQKKLNDKNVAHPSLFVAWELPASLVMYDFIFLDSVNKLGLKPNDLTRLKAANPTKSFVFIFQTTKEGKFRGANTFQHDVDVVIEAPEVDKAVQFGRFNRAVKLTSLILASINLP
jgi:predicted ATP-dependent serine protease